MTNSRDLTTGPVCANLVRLAGPMMFGIIAVISVSLIDTYYVAQLGTQELTALSFAFPVTMAISSLAIGLGAGASSVVSRAIGAADEKDARRLATDAIVLAMIMVICVAIIGYMSIDWLFGLLGASGDTLDLIKRYMQIWFFAVPLLVVPIVANAIVRAVGDAFWPSAIMIGSALINVTVTPLFIFGWGPIPAMNIEGAAIGTMIAWAFTMVGAFILVGIREKMISFTIPDMSDMWQSWVRVLSVGIPAALGNAVNPIGIAVVTAILATFGDTIVAGFGVATRIESLSVIPMLALSSAIGPFTGQNWGADKGARIISALKLSYIICIIWALVLSLVFWLFASSIVGIFSEDEEVINSASRYLTIVPITVWGYGMVIISAGAYNAFGKSKVGLGFYLIRTALLYIPLSFLAAMLAEQWAVFVAIAITNAISGIIVAAYALWWLTKKVATASEATLQPAG